MSLSHHVEEVRSAADSRDIELAMNIFVLGEHVPPWVRGFIDANAETLIKHDGRRHSEDREPQHASGSGKQVHLNVAMPTRRTSH